MALNTLVHVHIAIDPEVFLIPYSE